LIFFSGPLFADSLFLSQNARTFDTQQSSLIVKGLGNSCLGITMIPDSLPCNPAMLPFYTKPHLGVQALLSNGYATLDKMRKLLDGKVSQDTIDALFAKDHVLQVEGNGELNFISRYFAARYTPITVRYFSVIRNEANPEVELSAVEEKNVILQGAYPLRNYLNIGLQAKSFSRRYIKERFQLVDLATDAGKDQLKPRTQQGLLFNPAATLFLPGEYKPRVALMVANLGVINGDKTRLGEPTELQASGAITVPLGWTELEVDLDYKSLSYDESGEQKFHGGAILHFGTMSLTAGADYYGFSG
jgi:hypothetical protein